MWSEEGFHRGDLEQHKRLEPKYGEEGVPMGRQPSMSCQSLEG